AAVDALATVIGGMTARITVVSPCSSLPGGAVDVNTRFDRPPLITGLDITPGTFTTVCQQVMMTVTADDPDGDPVTDAFSIVTKPEGSRASLVGSGTTARFSAALAGDYLLKVTADDGRGATASLTFPIHAPLGECLIPDAPPPVDLSGT